MGFWLAKDEQMLTPLWNPTKRLSMSADLMAEPVSTLTREPLPEQEPAPSFTVIEPPRGWQLINLRELWRFRELIYFLAWRDVKVRYKQTVLGAAWAILQPVMMMVVFTIFFSRMAGVSSGDLPYPLFAFAGLLAWTFFSTAIANAGNSVVGSERLITKIYFPRLAIPFATVAAAVVDFLLASTMLLLMMVCYGVPPGPGLLLVPVVFAMILLAALGIGTLLAALNVAYRDFRYVIPFMLQLWMFATPAIYMQPAGPAPWGHELAAGRPASASRQHDPASTPEQTPRTVDDDRGRSGVRPVVEALLIANPLNGLVSGFRAAVLGDQIPWPQLGLSSLAAVILFVLGCLYFRKVEDGFADII
jgi:lipopolysaccharide transport system permease protein